MKKPRQHRSDTRREPQRALDDLPADTITACLDLLKMIRAGHIATFPTGSESSFYAARLERAGLIRLVLDDSEAVPLWRVA